MRRSSANSFSIRRIWLRQIYFCRRLSTKWIVFLSLCILYLISITPYPFSSQYDDVSIDQDVIWSRISELIQAKQIVLERDILSNPTKVMYRGTMERPESKILLILLYTTVFSQKKFCHFSSMRVFGASCPSRNRCQWSCDSRRLAEADAIIFHAYDIQYHQKHLPKRTETKEKSIWILWSDEPPSVINYTLFQAYQFNWTMSYKLTSEVSMGTYGLFYQRELTLSNPDYNRWIQEQFEKRRNGALWFVSNCAAKERLQYYYDLRKQSNIKVEGYGRCVDYYPLHWCSPGTRCEHNYMAKYKFFLSFESTTCRDYITEKFYKSLYHGLIPVVYGPDQNDYNNFAPPNSYIHINEHNANMTNVANYLHAVHSNFELYSMYHQWRKKYLMVIDKKSLDKVRMCELCERITKSRVDDITYHQDIETFFREGC